MLRSRHEHGAVVTALPVTPALDFDHGENEESSQVVEAAVRVIHGASVQTLPMAGLRVAEAARLVHAILRVDPRSAPLINGRSARQDYTLRCGDVLEFVHYAGEKGRHGPQDRDR
jgi:hypothetical protein